ncbi:MAG: hypothetical protein ACRERX_15230 [Pseudomonas sp.]
MSGVFKLGLLEVDAVKQQRLRWGSSFRSCMCDQQQFRDHQRRLGSGSNQRTEEANFDFGCRVQDVGG